MDIRTDEIADGVYRISAYVPEVAAPAGFTFNHFLVDAEEPLLYHAGFGEMFPLVADAVARVVPVERLRWISFAHVEADECGAMNHWLRAAPRAEVAHSQLGCELSLNDLADRPPRAVADGEVLDLGGKRMRFIQTSHVPHNWESQVAFEETTGTLFCGDLFSQVGAARPVTEGDIVTRAEETEDMFRANSLSAYAGRTIRGLADLDPHALAIMHGASFTGDCATVLRDLAATYDRRIIEIVEQGRAGEQDPLVAPGGGCPTL